jgi:hypothetical protein
MKLPRRAPLDRLDQRNQHYVLPEAQFQFHPRYRAGFEHHAAAPGHAGKSIGKKSGYIWDESYQGQRYFKDGEAGWDAAIKYMNEMMADPRK